MNHWSFWSFLLLLFALCPSKAQNAIYVKDPAHVSSLTGHVYIFIDQKEEWSIQDIVAGKLDARFVEHKGNSLNFGYQRHSVWLRFIVQKSFDENIYLKIGNPNLDSIVLFKVEASGNVLTRANSGQRATQKMVFSNDQILKLEQEPCISTTWYLKVKTNIIPEQVVGQISTLDTFIKPQTFDNLSFGVYAGIILLICFFGLCLFLGLRDFTYLFYIAYNLLFLNMMFLITGYYTLIYPQGMINFMIQFLPAINLIWVLCVSAFSVRFLEMKRYAPLLLMGIKGIIIISLILIFLVFAGYAAFVYQIFEQLTLFVSLYLMVSAAICLKKGYQLAIFYLLGFSFLIFSGAFVIFTNLGLLTFNDFSYHSLKAGHALEVLFFSLGLARKISLLNNEKLQIQETLIEELREKEQNLKERKEIELLFGQQVSKEIVRQLIQEKGRPMSRYMDVSVLFLDIRDFTPFAESLPPKEVVRFQNIVFDAFINIIDKHGGIINTLLGDGLMATFGVPSLRESHPEDAVRAGLEMTQAVKELSDAGKIPETHIGIGIHSGQVIVGNIGNDIRKEFSLSGLTVIKAARLEQLNKKLKTECLISKETYDRIDKKNVEIQYMGEIRLKGIGNAVSVYSVKTSKGVLA